MNKEFVLVSAFAVIFSSTAIAQEHRHGDRYGGHYGQHYDRESYEYGLYAGVSAGSLFYDEEQLDTLAPTIVMLRLGQRFSPNVAIEGRIGTSIRGDESDGFRVNAEALYGGYIKGIVPVSPVFSVYGLAGVAGVQMHRNYPDFNSNEAGLSFGIGIEFDLGGGASVNGEWVRLTTGTNDRDFDYTADQLTFGVNWRW